MLRILFVDDQQVELEGMRRLLNWADLGLEWAGGVTDARVALQRIQQDRIDIVVTDVIMQNMDGLTLLKLLREKYPHVHTICISGFDDFKFVGTAINQGACGYVLKPILVNELRSVLERVVKDIQKERGGGEITPEKLAMLLLGAVPEGIGQELLLTSVRLVRGNGEIPAQALCGLALSDGRCLYVLRAEEKTPADVWASDPLPLGSVAEARRALEAREASDGRGLAGREDVVERIKKNVEMHLKEDADMRVLLEGVFLSASHASALFKNATGMSIHRYMIHRRLAEAARLLVEEPEIRVKDIAWLCGFSDASHLINSFQKRYGMTPEKYRRRQAHDETDQ